MKIKPLFVTLLVLIVSHPLFSEDAASRVCRKIFYKALQN
jgi:hypothetical protein